MLNFAEYAVKRKFELRRITLPRTSVNKGKEKARAVRPWPSQTVSLSSTLAI